MNTCESVAKRIRSSIDKEGTEIARAYLYILTNDLHDAPFGFIEDVYVNSAHRGTGAGRELLNAVLTRAQAEKCYKLIATSRNDGTKQSVHDWYTRLGFRNYGIEFRIDF